MLQKMASKSILLLGIFLVVATKVYSYEEDHVYSYEEDLKIVVNYANPSAPSVLAPPVKLSPTPVVTAPTPPSPVKTPPTTPPSPTSPPLAKTPPYQSPPIVKLPSPPPVTTPTSPPPFSSSLPAHLATPISLQEQALALFQTTSGISNHLFLAYSSVDPCQLYLLRAANVSPEKLARAAVRNGLPRYVRHNMLSIVDMINEFVDAVGCEDDCALVMYGGSVKAPKILADIVESVAAAVYVDVDLDLKKLWVIIRGLLEPIVTLQDLEQKPQPVTMLYEICQKNGKKVDIEQQRNGPKSTASVYVDGELVASASSDQKDITRLEAAKAALHKLQR